ncbi:MAG: ATP-dependent Clp protease adapter ClpS [Proteobacteria bacterium]|nr:ATP-dependent Clp protease adapter ClpS [Pseudomonadota bacterium]
MYEVCLLNDDYTPMEFVIIVLQKFFAMKKENATQIMLKVHREGRAVCGVYSKDIAASKVSAVLDFAKVYQHPLQCVMEKK